MSQFAQSLRQAQILILEILNVFLWLKLSPSLTLNKLKHFETDSVVKFFRRRLSLLPKIQGVLKYYESSDST